jgi:hypothetical protein
MSKEIKTGRPPGRPREFAPRIKITARIVPEVHARLMASAEANGRSISEEIEHRIAKSFEADTIGLRLDAMLAGQRSLMCKLDAQFVAWEPGEMEAWLAGISAAREAQIVADNARALRDNNAKPSYDVAAAIGRLDKIAEDAGLTPPKKQGDAA